MIGGDRERWRDGGRERESESVCVRERCGREIERGRERDMGRGSEGERIRE